MSLREAGMFAIGVVALGVAKFGVPQGLHADWLSDWAKPDEPQRYMSSTNPWAKHYDPQAAAPVLWFANCDAARRAGVAPMERGEPGYRSLLDRDNDGTACEPWRGR